MLFLQHMFNHQLILKIYKVQAGFELIVSKRSLTCALMDMVTVCFFVVAGPSGSHMVVQTSFHYLGFRIHMG